LFETLIVSFELTNASTAFQYFINDALRLFLDIFCSTYLDDILIYSSTLKEHKNHVRAIVEVLAGAELCLNFDKCKFYRQKIFYLELIVSNKELSMDSEKIAAVAN
jgi:hypothetical protein